MISMCKTLFFIISLFIIVESSLAWGNRERIKFDNVAESSITNERSSRRSPDINKRANNVAESSITKERSSRRSSDRKTKRSQTKEKAPSSTKRNKTLPIIKEKNKEFVFELIRDNNYSTLKFLIQQNVSVINTTNQQGLTPLFYAVQRLASNKIIELLIKYSDLENTIESNRKNILMYALENKLNPVVIVKIITTDIDINTKDAEGNTALHYAIMYNASTAVLRQIIKNDASINALNNSGENALIIAARYSSGIANINILIKNGIDSKAVDNMGISPIIAAVFNKNPEILRFFIGKRKIFDINYQSQTGGNALMYAISQNNLRYVRNLINARINIETADNNGKTALMYAAQLSTNTDILALLIRSKANPNTIDGNGKTALMYATRYNSNPKVLEFLLALKNIDIKLRDKNNKTAFDYAKYNQNIAKTAIYWQLNNMTIGNHKPQQKSKTRR